MSWISTVLKVVKRAFQSLWSSSMLAKQRESAASSYLQPKTQDGPRKLNLEDSWRDVIFVPFIRVISWIIMVCTYLSVMYSIFQLAYHPSNVPTMVQHFFVAIEVIYFFYAILLVLHRMMKTHRSRRIYKPTPVLLLAVDFVSIMPVANLYTTLNRYTWTQQFTASDVAYHGCYLRFVRIIRLIFYHFDLRKNLTLDQGFIIFLSHVLNSFLIIFVVAAIYHYSALHPPPGNFHSWIFDWLPDDSSFDRSNNVNWFIICTYQIGGLYFNNSLMTLQYTNMNDYMLVFTSMLLGFISQYTYLMGALTSEQYQNMRPKYNLQLRLTAAKRLMPTLKMTDEEQKALLKYYETIWNSRNGIVTMPEIIEKLPLMMQNDIMTDIYWDALRHTKVFHHFNIVFRKVIAGIMKTEIYMPNHLIYRENDMKTKLVYVHSGVLEISTASSVETLSLTSGSVLCELSCITINPCNANVRCVTTCTLHVLEMVDLYMLLLKKHSAEFKTMRAIYADRLRYCKLKLKAVKTKSEMSHLSWVRSQWHNLYENKVLKFSEHFTSRYLDMISIVRTAAHPKAFCLRGDCPFVMVRETSLYAFFYFLALGATVVNFFISILTICFERKIDVFMYKYYVLLDLIFMFDIYIQSITTIKTVSGLIERPYDIWVYRLKDIFFLANVFGTIPFDYIGLLVGATPQSLALLRVNRFIRLSEVVVFFQYQENRLSSYMGLKQFIKFTVYHVLMALILTSLVFVVNCDATTCHYHSFLELMKVNYFLKYNLQHPLSNFCICLYYTLNIYLKLLLRVYWQLYLPDVMFKIGIAVLSYYVRTYEMSQYCALVALHYESTHQLQEQVEMIDIYVSKDKTIKKYRSHLLDVLVTGWNVSSSVRYKDLCQITYQQSDFLRKHIIDEHIRWILEQTEFFKDFPPDLLKYLAHRCDVFLIPEKHELLRYNQHCFYLYVVVEGYCIQRSLAAGDVERNHTSYYKPYDIFPVLEYLHRVNSLMYVETYTAVQVLSIPYSVYQNCISVYSGQQRIVDSSLQWHMRQYWGMLKRPTTIDLMTSDKVRSDKPQMFEYEIHRQKLILDITNCSRQKSNDSKYLKYRKTMRLIVVTTYSPNSRSYMTYEIFRCLCIIVHVNLTIYLVVKDVFINPWVHFAIYMMYFMWFCDMLIQGHLEYYNEYGILVSDLQATTVRYMKHSFLIDLLAGMPYDILQFKAFVNAQRRESVDILIIVTARMLLLLRPYQLSQYLQGNGVLRGQQALKVISLVLAIYHVIMYLSVVKLMLTCDINEQREFVCPEMSWIKIRNKFPEWTQEFYFWITIRSVLVSGVSVAENVSSKFDHIMTLVIGILVSHLRIAILSSIVGSRCVRLARVVNHQDSLTHYNTFFRNRMVSNNTKSELLNHYKNLWQKSYSVTSTKVFKNIYPNLRETLMFAMYRKAVSKCIIFQDQNNVLFTLFIPYVEERNYIKDAEIIRTNDVQGNIFIVVNGVVAMYMAGSRLAMLGPGGIFGCFEPLGLNRHTMAATARQHTTVLVIKATRFYQLIKGFSKIENVMRQLRFTQFQFATMQKDDRALYESIAFSMKQQQVETYHSYYREAYKIYMYITNMIVAPLSTYVLLVDASLEMGVMKMLPCWIVLDIYFFVVCIFRGRIPTTDTSTGFQMNRKYLLRQYLKSFLFIIDILTMLPIYIVRIFLHLDWHQFWFMFNKLFRLYFLYHHYQSYVRNKNIPRHIQWTLMVYSTLFLAEIIFLIWWFIMQKPYEAKNNLEHFIMGYIYMMNYVSTAGMDIITFYEPSYVVQICVDMLLASMATMLTITLAMLFVRVVILSNTYECVYRYNARYCRQFCRISGVSEGLVTRNWNYLHYLYRKQGGEQFPRLYFPAPRYLKQDHMKSLYGKHFNDHALFHDLHVDLLRQIQTHIKCNYFVPGSIIVETGSKNSKIYFVDRGSVLAIQSNEEKKSTTYEILEAGKSFGEMTAFLSMEHSRTYKALNEVDLLAIDVDEWEHLLDWFPASKQKLLSRVKEHSKILHYKEHM